MRTTTRPVTITRQQAHDSGACTEDTRRVLDHLRARDGRIPRKTQPISLLDVTDVLGIDGLIWCLDARGEHALLRRFACLCARRALRRDDVRDPRSWRAVRVAWWHAHGWASDDDLVAARRDAPRAVAWADVQFASLAVVGHAASDDALFASLAASMDGASRAAWDADRDWQTLTLLALAGYGGAA